MGYGSAVLQALMEKAAALGCTNAELSARTSAKAFYKKYGFIEVGAVYASQKTGIPHVKMQYNSNLAL